jgi:electron transport complex protein RnfD
MAKVAKGKAASVAMSPHVHSPQSLHSIMWDVVIALIPATLASIYYFGYNSIRIIAISVGTPSSRKRLCA